MPDLDAPLPPAAAPAEAAPVPPAAAAAVAPVPPAAAAATWKPRHTLAVVFLVAVMCAVALVFALQAKERVRSLEQELVRRQQETANQAGEARAMSRQAEESARATAAKMALLEARVAEVAVQRGQIEDLVASLSRSRDENLLIDLEAAVRMALRQSVLTGSTEPLVATLRQADERLARHDEPRLEGVRRAVARDLDRIRAVAVADTSILGMRLDEAVRLVDELPLASQPGQRSDAPAGPPPVQRRMAAAPASASASASASAAAAGAGGIAAGLPEWLRPWTDAAATFSARVWNEVRTLVRVSRIDHPEAMLIAPDQAFFLRENLKLRLLNARLALLARQFDTAQADLHQAQRALDRWFDPAARRTQLAAELVRQVAQQARHTGLPRPDDTLAALATAAAGR